MHVGYDAAECHHHILGYLKIDLPACVCVRTCVCVCALLLRTGLVVVYCPSFTLSFRPAVVALLVQWCSTRHGAGVGYMNWVHVGPLSGSHSFPLSPSLTYTYMHART